MEKKETPRRKNQSKENLDPNHLGRAQELVTLALQENLSREQREHLVMRISYLLFITKKTWRDIGVTPDEIRELLVQDVLQEARELLTEIRSEYRNYKLKQDVYNIRSRLAWVKKKPTAIGITEKNLEQLANSGPPPRRKRLRRRKKAEKT